MCENYSTRMREGKVVPGKTMKAYAMSCDTALLLDGGG